MTSGCVRRRCGYDERLGAEDVWLQRAAACGGRVATTSGYVRGTCGYDERPGLEDVWLQRMAGARAAHDRWRTERDRWRTEREPARAAGRSWPSGGNLP